jgi:hypothetical protein
MGNTKALIVGVSQYLIPEVNNLPFCKNDINAIRTAFIHGLTVAPENITTCGLRDIVTTSEFIASLQNFEKITQDDDTLLFYFSGHGTPRNGDHCLALSDKLISTQEIIAYLDAIPAKNKVIFLDCCFAGNFQVGGSAVLDVESTVSNFAGKGYAVFASSNASQCSYSHPRKPISLFTSFLCDAITSKFVIREGKKSLNDIHKLLFLLLEIWNKNNPTRIQTPIYRANMGGTIFFDVEDYKPYIPEKFFYDDEKYCICTVEPLHNGIAKRYAVKAIIKVPMSLEEISLVNLQIIEKVKVLNVFSNETEERQWNNQPTNLIFCYFGLDQSDIAFENYICHTTWADDTQDKKWWYRISKKSDEVINGIHFNVHSYYQSLKELTAEHTATSEEIKKATKSILTEMITLAEYVISQYNELLNKEQTEEDFIDCISDAFSRINTLYFEEGDLALPPEELQEWSQLCSNLASDIHDFTIFYGSQHFLQRTPENRQQCMNASIKRYYKDLKCLKDYESGS